MNFVWGSRKSKLKFKREGETKKCCLYLKLPNYKKNQVKETYNLDWPSENYILLHVIVALVRVCGHNSGFLEISTSWFFFVICLLFSKTHTHTHTHTHIYIYIYIYI